MSTRRLKKKRAALLDSSDDEEEDDVFAPVAQEESLDDDPFADSSDDDQKPPAKTAKPSRIIQASNDDDDAMITSLYSDSEQEQDGWNQKKHRMKALLQKAKAKRQKNAQERSMKPAPKAQRPVDYWMEEEDPPPEDPELTHELYMTIYKILMNKAMHGPRPLDQMWTTVRQNLPNSILSLFEFHNVKCTPEALERVFERYYDWIRTDDHPNWNEVYSLLRMPLEQQEQGTTTHPNWLTLEQWKQSLVPGGQARVDVYWRALDRWPGGNKDLYVVCFTLDCQTQTVSVRHAQNGDGDLARREYRPLELSQTLQTKDHFSSFLQAMANLGWGESECTLVDDISRDGEEFDSTWSSHEILVYLPRPWHPSVHHRFPASFRETARAFLRVAPRLPTSILRKILEFAVPQQYVPVSRFHQRCVVGPQHFLHGRLSQEAPIQPPSDLQQQVLNTASALIGMGRVNTWAYGDEAPPCPAAQDREESLNKTGCQMDKCPGYTHYHRQPLYFDFSAQNLVTEEENSRGSETSGMWKTLPGTPYRR